MRKFLASTMGLGILGVSMLVFEGVYVQKFYAYMILRVDGDGATGEFA